MCDQIILSPGIKKISILCFFFIFSSNVSNWGHVGIIPGLSRPHPLLLILQNTQMCLWYFNDCALIIKVVQSFIDLNIYFGKSSHFWGWKEKQRLDPAKHSYTGLILSSLWDIVWWREAERPGRISSHTIFMHLFVFIILIKILKKNDLNATMATAQDVSTTKISEENKPGSGVGDNFTADAILFKCNYQAGDILGEKSGSAGFRSSRFIMWGEQLNSDVCSFRHHLNSALQTESRHLKRSFIKSSWATRRIARWMRKGNFSGIFPQAKSQLYDLLVWRERNQTSSASFQSRRELWHYGGAVYINKHESLTCGSGKKSNSL